jgi:hypothetical protein
MRGEFNQKRADQLTEWIIATWEWYCDHHFSERSIEEQKAAEEGFSLGMQAYVQEIRWIHADIRDHLRDIEDAKKRVRYFRRKNSQIVNTSDYLLRALWDWPIREDQDEEDVEAEWDYQT